MLVCEQQLIKKTEKLQSYHRHNSVDDMCTHLTLSATTHCNKIKVISTLLWLAQLHLFRSSLYNIHSIRFI